MLQIKIHTYTIQLNFCKIIPLIKSIPSFHHILKGHPKIIPSFHSLHHTDTKQQATTTN